MEQTDAKHTGHIESRADRLMRMVDERIGKPINAWTNQTRLEILGALLEQIELAINEAKERTF